MSVNACEVTELALQPSGDNFCHQTDGATATPASPSTPEAIGVVNGLRRTGGDRWIGGVCGGLARATGMEAWAWRLIFTVIFLCGGAGLLLYVLLWIFVPAE